MRKIARMPSARPAPAPSHDAEGGESPHALAAAAGARLRRALDEMLVVERDADTRFLVAAARRAVDRDLLRLRRGSDVEASEMTEAFCERLRVVDAARSDARRSLVRSSR